MTDHPWTCGEPTDEVERVLQAAVGSIGERLGKGLPEGVAWYHGRP